MVLRHGLCPRGGNPPSDDEGPPRATARTRFPAVRRRRPRRQAEGTSPAARQPAPARDWQHRPTTLSGSTDRQHRPAALSGNLGEHNLGRKHVPEGVPPHRWTDVVEEQRHACVWGLGVGLRPARIRARERPSPFSNYNVPMVTRCAWFVPAGVVLAVACRGTPAPAPVDGGPREVWYSIRDDQQAYGYTHLRVRGHEDGASTYELDSRLEIEFFGARQEVRTDATAVVEPDLTLRSLEAETTHASGVVRVHATATADGWTVEQGPAATPTRNVPRDGPPLIIGSVLGEWLAHELSRGTAGDVVRTVRLLSEESGDVAEITLRLLAREANGSRWSIDTGEEWQETTLRLDANGELVEQRVSLPPLHVLRAPREEALAFHTRVVPERELLTFRVDRDLPPVRQLASLDVELSWQAIPVAEFELEDARQRVVSLTDEAGRYTAIVRLERAAEGKADATRPLPRAGFERELASDGFILPADDSIAAQAAELVGAESSARAAARTLCRWVSEAVRSEMIAETLSGPQVLERRVGKCTEYATLFASLARAAGIPTRIALGQRRFAGADGDTWGGHMWNEVFVGEWIPVDASANDFGGSLDLLKFVHSDTVAGTQPLRWKLTKSLEVRIADVKLRATDADALTTGLRVQTYTNAEHGFRVDLPDANWTLTESRQSGALVVRMRPPDPDLGDAAMFHVTAFALPAGLAPKTILDGRLRHQRKGLEQVEVLRDEPAELGDIAGHRLCFTGRPAGGQPLRISELLFVHDGTGVLINLIATPELHELHAAAFEQIAASLVFVD
ncbi:MAG: transglutaminase domain-containing protein [Planctomycetota bacterium]